MTNLNLIGILAFAWLSMPIVLQFTIWLLELHGFEVDRLPKQEPRPAIMWIFDWAENHKLHHAIASLVAAVAIVV